MNILIINEGLSHNLGDQAINFTLKNLLERKNYNVTFSSYSTTPNISKNSLKGIDKTITSLFLKLKKFVPKTFKDRIYKTRFKTRKKFQIRNLLNKKNNFDIAIIGGGQLLNLNRTFPVALKIWSECLNNYGISTYLFSVGYGASWKNTNRKILKECLDKIDGLFLRDTLSIKRINEQFNFKANFVFDVAFSISNFIESNHRQNYLFTILPASYEHVIKRYNPNLSKQNYLKKMAAKCIVFANKGYKIQLSKTDLFQDSDIMYDLSKILSTMNVTHSIKIPINLVELCAIISESAIIYSGRMHALIIGYSYECNCIPFLVSNKLKTFKTEIIDNAVPLTEINKNIDYSIDLLIKQV